MRLRPAALLLLLFASVFAQKADPARGIYAQNGTLIGLADLAPLRECPVRAMEGKARAVKVKDGVVTFDLKSDDRKMTFSFPVNRLDGPERRIFRKDFLHKGLTLRATGYDCSPDQPLETISIDRSY